jgi:hypothetical protein
MEKENGAIRRNQAQIGNKKIRKHSTAKFQKVRERWDTMMQQVLLSSPPQKLRQNEAGVLVSCPDGHC